jgi:hypothetical protein
LPVKQFFAGTVPSDPVASPLRIPGPQGILATMGRGAIATYGGRTGMRADILVQPQHSRGPMRERTVESL